LTTQAVAVAGLKRARHTGSGAWLLSGAMVASGVLAYAFHVLAARALGPQAYGQIAVLWAAMFLAAIVLFRPLEQTTSRAIAERLARGDEVWTVVRSVGLICGALVALCLLAAALGWEQISDRLFLGDDLLTGMLLLGIAAYGLAYLVRGLLGGLRWFNGYGLGLIADAVARLLVAAPLVLIASEGLAGAAMVAAGLAGAVVPLYLGRRLLGSLFTHRAGARFPLASALAFAAPASIIAVSDQLLVNGGALLVVVEGGQEATKVAGVVFAATMLVRAPVYVFQGLAASMLPNLTHIQALDDLTRFRRAVLRATGFLLAAGGVIVGLVAVAGPQVMEMLYGEGFEASRLELTLLGAGVACYLAAATFSQALLALDAGVRAAVAWSISSVFFVSFYFALPGSELARVSLAFALAAVSGLLLLGFGLARRLTKR
jgi:O-antigen/teichoic acid export membrane protein